MLHLPPAELLAGAAVTHPAPPGSSATSPADSIATYHLGELLVTASSPGLVGEPGHTEVPWTVLAEQDGGTAEDLAPLVPSTRAATNSRGEVVFTVRGASERQVGIFQDGVQLDIPWDERVDASFIPLGVVGAVIAERGGSSILDGPNTPGGVIHLVSRDLDTDGRRTRLWAQGGVGERRRTGLLHLARSGDWSAAAAVEHRRRQAFLVSHDLDAMHNQPPDRRRANSDLQQTAIYLRALRTIATDGSFALSLHALDSTKGVPPETHLQNARFWRIPSWRRLLVSAQGECIIDEERRWLLSGGLSLDAIRQEIQGYPDSTYTAPAAELDADFETGRDRTAAMRLRLKRQGRRSQQRALALGLTLRATRHRESEERRGPELAFSQVLASTAVEWDGRVTPNWRLRAGAAYDHVATPQTGDKPARSADGASAMSLRLSRDQGELGQLHLSFASRSRFPSLRELYSGALGRFVPNPQLVPEVLTTAEVGAGWRGDRVELALSGYAQQVDRGIVRVSLSDGRIQRRNADMIRLLGFEMHGRLQLPHQSHLDLNHAFLRARRRGDDGRFDQPVERRAYFLSHLALSVPLAGELRSRCELVATGAHYGLDASVSDLVRLSSAATCNLRLARYWRPDAWRHWSGEIFVRVDNIFDQETLSQPGLPEPGREFVVGMRIEL